MSPGGWCSYDTSECQTVVVMLSWISKLKVELASLWSGKKFRYAQIERVTGKLTCIRDGFVGNPLDGLKWGECATYTTNEYDLARIGVKLIGDSRWNKGCICLSQHTFRSGGPIPDKHLVPGR